MAEHVAKHGRKAEAGVPRGNTSLLFGFMDEVGTSAGSHRDDRSYLFCHALFEYVARKVERDAGIQKQVRKAREERAGATKQGKQ